PVRTRLAEPERAACTDVHPDAVPVPPLVGGGDDRQLARGGDAADPRQRFADVRGLGGELCGVRDLLPRTPAAGAYPRARRIAARAAADTLVDDLRARERRVLLDDPNVNAIAGRDAGNENDASLVACDGVGSVAEGRDLEGNGPGGARALVL